MRLARQAKFVIRALVAAPLVPTDIRGGIWRAAVKAVARMLMSMADACAETQLQHCDKDSERSPLP